MKLDPITGKPLHEMVLNPIVRGEEIEPVDSGTEEEAAEAGPDVRVDSGPVRSDRGTQLYVQVEPGDDREAIVSKARAAWREARKNMRLDDD